jgi:hypothetical protein
MSTLTVTTINTVNAITDATITTGNTNGPKLVITSGNGINFYANSTVSPFNIAANGSFGDAYGALRDLPISNQTSSYTLSSTDAGRVISSNTSVTIPASIFANGQNVTIVNYGITNVSIVSASGVTCYLGGTANTSTRTLFQKGIATILCVSPNTFIATGAGLF